MSLFICQNPACGCVENTNLVTKNILSNDNYPNMHLMDMQGYGGEITYSGTEFLKHPQDILMLCSECNTGIWHDEFPKELPDEETIALSKLSKFSAITPMDHPAGSIVKNKKSEWGKSNEYRMATQEEIEAYHLGKKRSRDTMAKIAGLVGPDVFNSFFSRYNTPRKRDSQTPEDKKRTMFKAELKRNIKKLKKDILKETDSEVKKLLQIDLDRYNTKYKEL